MLETLSPTAASISCRRTSQSWFRVRLRRRGRPSLPQVARTGAAPRESISSVYLAACGDLFVDGCHPPGRNCWLYTTAGLRLAASRLSDNSGGHVLSRSKPDGDVDDGDGATGAPIRPTTGVEPDDLHQFRGHFRHCAAVQPQSEYRYSGARGTV